MFALFASYIGISMSIFGITLFYEVKNRKSIRKKHLKMTIPKLGFKFKSYLLLTATTFISTIGLFSFEPLLEAKRPELLFIILVASFLMIVQLLETLFGIKHITIGNILSKEEVSKLVHLNEKKNVFIDNEFCPLRESEYLVRFRKVLKDGSKRMAIEDFVSYSIPSEKIESVLEMKNQLQELEILIESNLLKGYFNDKNESEECKKGIALVNSIHDAFYDLRKDVAMQTFSKKMVQQAEKANHKHLAVSNQVEKTMVPNDLGLALLDMKSVSGDIQYSLEDRKRADEYVLRIEKELEKRNEKLKKEKLKENVHVLFKTVEDVLEKNNI